MQDPPKFTQNWIFGLKTNHLATLSASDTIPRRFLLQTGGSNTTMITRHHCHHFPTLSLEHLSLPIPLKMTLFLKKQCHETTFALSSVLSKKHIFLAAF
jgi:hypothetical protein